MDQNNKKYVLLSCAVILLIACICMGVIVISGVGISSIFPLFKSGQATLPPTSTTARIHEETEVEEIQVEKTPTEESGMSEELLEAMDRIEWQVSQVRGLQSTGPVERALITTEELEEIVTTDFFSEYTEEDARQDVLILSAIGLLPEGFNLKQLYTDLYSEQIAGFYDSELKEMYVVQGTEFGGYEKYVYAHEYTHVLQDQVYGLDEGLGLNNEACEADSERCAAVTALTEGDAMLTQMIWFFTYASEQDYEELMQAVEGIESPILDSAPAYISADLQFPYDYGYSFVEMLYNEGDYNAVEAAYEDVPVSTEQILHPERYPDDKPVQVALPDLTERLGEEWALYDQNVMGEWFIYLILNKAYDKAYQLPEDIAEDAAEGWGGDAYAFYLNEETDQVVFVMDVVWETLQDADEFADTFIDYAGLRWETADSTVQGYSTWSGANGTVILMQEGDRTLWVMAPEAEMVESILTALQ